MNRGNNMSEYTNSGIYMYKENELSFNFNTSLSAEQKIQFVNIVANIVAGENYYDFLTDIVFDFALVTNLTDIDLSEVDDLNSIEDFLNDTNIVDVIRENVDYEFINSLRYSVDRCIEYKTGIHRNIVEEYFGSLIKTFENMISNVDMNEIVNVGKMLSGASNELTADKILEAYRKSDMYKESWKQAFADKDASSTFMSSNYEA